jgi:hypothetical protein
MKNYIFWNVTLIRSTDVSEKQVAFRFSVEEYAQQGISMEHAASKAAYASAYDCYFLDRFCSAAVPSQQNSTKKEWARSIWLRYRDLYVIISSEYSSPSHMESTVDISKSVSVQSSHLVQL